MSWTDEKVEKLKDLWDEGHTASEIANMLGDTTRNAVIGKAHRLNLEARAIAIAEPTNPKPCTTIFFITKLKFIFFSK